MLQTSFRPKKGQPVSARVTRFYFAIVFQKQPILQLTINPLSRKRPTSVGVLKPYRSLRNRKSHCKSRFAKSQPSGFLARKRPQGTPKKHEVTHSLKNIIE